MLEKKIFFISQSHRPLGFTLVELIVAIFIGMIVIIAVMKALASLSENMQVIDDGFVAMENREVFKNDMMVLKKEYPTILINTGSIFLNSKYGFDVTVMEHVSGSGGIIVGTIMKTSDESSYATGIVVGVPAEYREYHPFYLKISDPEKENIKATQNINMATLNLSQIFVYSNIYCTKFIFSTLNLGEIWKFDMLTSGVFYKKKSGWAMSKAVSDSEFIEYNTSFLIR